MRRILAALLAAAILATSAQAVVFADDPAPTDGADPSISENGDSVQKQEDQTGTGEDKEETPAGEAEETPDTNLPVDGGDKTPDTDLPAEGEDKTEVTGPSTEGGETDGEQPGGNEDNTPDTGDESQQPVTDEENTDKDKEPVIDEEKKPDTVVDADKTTDEAKPDGEEKADADNNQAEAETQTKATLRGIVSLKSDKTASSGYTEVGAVLTADTSSLDIPEGAEVFYQWYRDGKEITGEASATYTTTEEDYSSRISVNVSTDMTSGEKGNSIQISKLSAIRIQITGVGYSGGGNGVKREDLGANGKRITDWNGKTYTIHLDMNDIDENETFEGWFINDNPEPVSKESSYTYTYGEETEYGVITDLVVKITRKNGGSSTPSGEVNISGWRGTSRAAIGYPVTVEISSEVPTEGRTYQWLRDDKEIEGATESVYTPVAEDENHNIALEVKVPSTESESKTLKSNALSVARLYEMSVILPQSGGGDGVSPDTVEEVDGVRKSIYKAWAGGEITLIAGTPSGYRFLGWYADGKCVGTDVRLIVVFGGMNYYPALEAKYEQDDTYRLNVGDLGTILKKEGYPTSEAQRIDLQNTGTGDLNLKISIMPDNEESKGVFEVSDQSMKLVAKSSERISVSILEGKPAGSYSAKLVVEDPERNVRAQKPLKLTVIGADAAEPKITAELIGLPKIIGYNRSLPRMNVEITYDYGEGKTEKQTVNASSLIGGYDRTTLGKQTITVNLGAYGIDDLIYEIESKDFIKGVSYRDNHQYEWKKDTELKLDGKVTTHMATGAYGERLDPKDPRLTFVQPDFSKIGVQETTVTYQDEPIPGIPISSTHHFRVHVRSTNSVNKPDSGKPSVNVGNTTLKTESGKEVSADENVKLIVEGVKDSDQKKVEQVIADKLPNATEENTMQVEISMETESGEKVQPADNGTISLWFPYPAGTGRGFIFKILHILGSSVEDIRNIIYEDGGIRFEVKSLSPFVISWEEGGSTPTPPTPEKPSKPDTSISYDSDDDDDDSSSSRSSAADNTPVYGDGTTINARTVKVTSSAVSSVVKKAAANGSTAKIYIADAASVSKSVLGSMKAPVTFAAAKYSITFDPAKMTEKKADVNLNIKTSAPAAQKTFERFFKEPVAAISCAQKGEFGGTVYIDIKPDSLNNINTSKPMYVYSWNAAANSYKKVGYAVLLKNSWIRCYTDRGYDLVVSNADSFTLK